MIGYVFHPDGIRVGRVVTRLAKRAGRAGVARSIVDLVRKECNLLTRRAWRRGIHRRNEVLVQELIAARNFVLSDFRDFDNSPLQAKTTISTRPSGRFNPYRLQQRNVDTVAR